MQIINNEELLNKYIKENKINNFFSYWDKYAVKLIRYEKGEIMCTRESPLKNITFIVQGAIKIYYLSSDGQIVSLAFKDGFNFLGDMEVVGENECPCSQAMTEVYCVCISIEDNLATLNNDLEFNKFLVKSLAKKLRNAGRNTYRKSFHSVKERLAEYILAVEEEGTINQNWSEAATLLSSSYRQLMRLLSQFCDEGLIQRKDKKGQYIIKDKNGLKKIACEI